MDPADFYTGIVVDAYARLRSTRFDPSPYADLVARSGGPALEIGCGDGDPLLDLVAAGLNVEGVDSSLDMVVRCRERARERGLTVTVHHQRAEDLELPGRYASVYFAGPTFNLLPDDATALRTLVSIRSHLATGGIALIPLWVPDPTSAAELGVVRTARDEGGVELRFTPLSETYDAAGRTRVTRCRYERVTTSGTEVADREWVLHWHTPSGFRRLCGQAGLDVVALRTDDGGPVTESATSFTAELVSG